MQFLVLILNKIYLSSYIAFFCLIHVTGILFQQWLGPRSCYAEERSSDRVCVVEITLNLQWACSCEAVSKFGTLVALHF